LADKIDHLGDIIDNGFSNMIAMFEHMPNREAARIAESQTTTTEQAKTQLPTYFVNSLYYRDVEDEFLDVTNQKQKTVHRKDRDEYTTTKPRKVLLTRALRNLADGKSTEKGGWPPRGRDSILTHGYSKRDVIGGEI
jgi:hypothetical protein